MIPARARRPERATRRWRRDDGVAIVEFAIVAPLLLLLAMGIWEFSMGWASNLKVQTGVRAGARTISSLGKDRNADYFGLKALNASLSDFKAADIKRVVIFKADSTNGAVPPACINASNTGVSGVCNVYKGSQVKNINANQGLYTGTTSCSTGSPDQLWCPTTRDDTQANSTYVGVYAEVYSKYASSWFPGGGITIKQTAVFRIEPKVT